MRRKLVEKAHQFLSIRQQCSLLNVSRSSLYYLPKPEKAENLELMRLMDEHGLDHPSEGARSMQWMLGQKGYRVNLKRVRRLLRKMGRCTVYRRKSLSKLGKAAYIFPYLLRELKIEKPNLVWCIDITYIPMKKGFLYCCAIIDVYSRLIVGWNISNSLEASWCLNVLEDAVATYGKPEIINSDQGAQFTSQDWVEKVKELDIKISMDGKGRALDNRWIERFWRTLKYDHVYLHPAEDGSVLTPKNKREMNK
jgi:putative transposase